MFESLKKKKHASQKDGLFDFEFEPRPINEKGNKNLDDMSLIQGIYQGFVITKTGELVGMIELSGINLELLNETEQGYAFDTLNTFLMNTLGDGTNEKQQFIDIPMAVDFDEYLLNLKHRYLTEDNEAVKELIASYIDDFKSKVSANTLSTKRHFLVVSEQIENKKKEALDKKSQDMNEKLHTYIKRLEDSFNMYNVQAKKLFPDETVTIFKTMMNFNGE